MKTLFRKVLKGEGGVGMIMVVAFMGLSIPIIVAALGTAGTYSKDSTVKSNLAKTQYSSIGAFEYIRYLSDDPETWSQWLDDNYDPVTDEVSETVTVGDYEIVVKADTDGYADYGFLDYCVFGSTSVHVSKHSIVNCGIGSNGNVTMNADSEVNGDITSGGDVVLGENAHVYGSVTVAGEVLWSPGASISGTLTEGATVETIAGPTPNYWVTMTFTNLNTGEESQEGKSVEGSSHSLTFNLEAGGPDETINSGETRSLDPGSYGTVEVKENATLELSSGDYAFDEIRIKEGVTINLNIAGGNPIVFDAVTVLEFKENVVMNVIGGNADDVVIRVENQAYFKEDGQYVGTYFGFEAANADMHAKENSTLTGALYGDTVEVKENTVVDGMPAEAVYLSFFGN